MVNSHDLKSMQNIEIIFFEDYFCLEQPLQILAASLFSTHMTNEVLRFLFSTWYFFQANEVSNKIQRGRCKCIPMMHLAMNNFNWKSKKGLKKILYFHTSSVFSQCCATGWRCCFARCLGKDTLFAGKKRTEKQQSKACGSQRLNACESVLSVSYYCAAATHHTWKSGSTCLLLFWQKIGR